MKRQKRLFMPGLRARFPSVPKGLKWKAVFVLPLLLAVALAAFVLHKSPVNAYPCPCNFFSTPTGQSNFSDGGTLELGFKFKPNINGYITGVRFYKQGSMTGVHIGNLWNTSGGPQLASATFSSESGSGWQDVVFSSPVAVTAGTTYIASVGMPDGNYVATPNYFNTDVTNYPLTVPSSANAGGNGVFATTAGSFPGNGSSNAANYWVDVDFKATNTPVPPHVSTVAPIQGATNIALGASLTASFDLAMNPNSFTSSSFIVKDSDGNTLSSTVSFDVNAQIATYVPTGGFETGKTYTATLKGGGGPAVQNIDGTPMAADYSWSFTAANTNPCPCSLKNRVNPAGVGTFDDLNSLELGTKIVPQTNGYITAVRFYKPISTTETTHDVHVWSSTGTSLASATSSNESDFGWQEVKLSSPLHLTAGSLYVVSYSTPTAVYMAQANGLSSTISSGYLTAYADGDSHNAATGSGNHNGVYTQTVGTYPNSGTSSFYWVDAVFSTNSASVIPPSPDSVQPSNNSYGVQRSTRIEARMSKALNPSTVTTTSVQLFDASNNPVSGTAGYDSGNHAITFTPSSTLAYGKKYSVKLAGSIQDVDGAGIGNDYTWSFTTGAQVSTDPNNGLGGPILVITSSGDNYSKYYAEILRAEGFTYFDVKDITTVSNSTLSSYSTVLLSELALSQGQADMFGAWVNAGGDLLAMRPDAKLSSLLGLNSSGTTQTNGYFLVDTAAAPGQGIVGETMQYKGVADGYTLNGATSVATLYSNASTSISKPAATVRHVGSSGGTAAAFTYDVAKSVIALHQGNKAWAGTDRDGDAAIRSNDMFFGAKAGDVQPDWIDLNKIQIPQADEQQRLMANILTEDSKDNVPLPRFWYLPHDYKAAVVLAGDDHALSNGAGTEHAFNQWLSNSPTNCSPIDWQCVRASGYVYVSSALTASRALQFEKVGFDLGAHPPGDGGGCGNYSSYTDVSTETTTALTNFRAKYIGLPNQRTTRFHCYIWADWDSQPRVDVDNGIRYDLDYVTYPPTWLGSTPALITGSGMNMRFTDATGNLVDVHQGVTNFENTVASASSINTVLDNATGATGYYGIFGTHYDMGDSFDTTLYNNIVTHNVPMISADQALSWLDGRESSTFSNFVSTKGKTSFDVVAAEGAVGLRAMIPIDDAGGTIADITTADGTVSRQTQQVKGVQYAVFDAVPGRYTVTYSDYDPNAATSTDGSSASDQGASNAPANKKKIAASNKGIFAQDSTVFEGNTPAAENADKTPDATFNPSTDEKPHSTKDNSEQGVHWIWWVGGLVLLLGLFLIFWLRKRRHDHYNAA